LHTDYKYTIIVFFLKLKKRIQAMTEQDFKKNVAIIAVATTSICCSYAILRFANWSQRHPNSTARPNIMEPARQLNQLSSEAELV